jgi:hypothetical protein
MAALVPDGGDRLRPDGTLPAVTAKVTFGPAASALLTAMVAE